MSKLQITKTEEFTGFYRNHGDATSEISVPMGVRNICPTDDDYVGALSLLLSGLGYDASIEGQRIWCNSRGDARDVEDILDAIGDDYYSVDSY